MSVPESQALAALAVIYEALLDLDHEAQRRVINAVQVLLPPPKLQLANPNAQGWIPNQNHRAQVAAFYENQQAATSARNHPRSPEHEAMQRAAHCGPRSALKDQILAADRNERLECAEPECPACPESFGGQECEPV